MVARWTSGASFVGRDDSARHPPARGPLAGRAAFLKVASLDFYRKRPRRLRRGGRPHFFPKKWGERRAGGLRPPWTPQYGGSWRRWAVQTGQRPAAHCRLFSWHSCHRRCRASGGTHRDYPASPDGRCAVPAWPAGPPLVPCRRNTMVFAAAACGAGERGLVRPSPAPSFQKSPGSAPQLRRAPLMLPRPASGWPGGPSAPG